jgi:uncharacterized membrane protein YgaE (UPF0421/DUF939 family)
MWEKLKRHKVKTAIGTVITLALITYLGLSPEMASAIVDALLALAE